MERLDALNSSVASVISRVAHLQEQISSSFQSSPAINANPSLVRPQASYGRIRPQVSRATKYARQFRFELDAQPENSMYSISFSASHNSFSICVNDDSGAQTSLFTCQGTREYLKSAFLIFGLVNYNVDNFLEHCRSNPIQPVESESLDGADLSRYAPPSNQDDEGDADEVVSIDDENY
jgi:hypothetical protein